MTHYVVVRAFSGHDVVPRIRFSVMNSTVNVWTGFSPFQLHIGRPPRLLHLLDPDVLRAAESHDDAAVDAADLIRRMANDGDRFPRVSG